MLTLDEERHVYIDEDGRELPSVTTITRFCSCDSRTSAGSNPFYRERGTLVHALCADFDLTGAECEGTGVDGFLRAYYDFCRDYRPRWDYVEWTIGGNGYAGTLDRYGLMDGRPAILDIKTSSHLNDAALTAQLTGYALMTMQRTGAIPKLYGLRLSKDGKYQLKEYHADIDLFRSCQVLHERMKPCQKKSS